MSSVVEQARDLVQKRLGELDDERKRLERALEELAGRNGHATRRVRGRGPGRPKGSSKRAGKTGAKRARRGGGRADQAVALIASKPGISASDIAAEMKIKPNYLYRVLGGLEVEGRVKKDGRQYYPVTK